MKYLFLSLAFTFSLTCQAKTLFYQQSIEDAPTQRKVSKKSNHGKQKLDKLTTLDALEKIKWEVGLVTAEALREGFSDWNWGSKSSFNIAHEGWLGANAKEGGADKFGHMYSSYVINEIFTKQLMKKTNNKAAAAKKAALFSSSIMLWLEVADGFSHYGFSYQDVVFNSLGVGLSYLRNTVPHLDKKFDLRISYKPTKGNSDRPVIDYSGHTNLFVVKLAGFNRFKKTPLKYLELQLGYHTEGYGKGGQQYYKEKRREVLFGVGLNLSETVFKPIEKHTDNSFVEYADTFFQYYQAPGIFTNKPIRTSKSPFK